MAILSIRERSSPHLGDDVRQVLKAVPNAAALSRRTLKNNGHAGSLCQSSIDQGGNLCNALF